jgi:two-component system, chemotaxis family, protein-glutamate methylesterase/glutaminase
MTAGQGRDIVVIGGSAGAIEGLQTIIRGLPPELSASIFIVIHSSPEAPGYLASIVSRECKLPVKQAVDQEAIVRGQVYVAKADHHLLLKNGKVRVVKGPRENGFRPAIDPLFRTAARYYGNRVVGVLLSGGLDDGTYGLMQIKGAGGFTIVQDPNEALNPSMPESAIDNVEVDQVLSAADIAAVLVDLVSTRLEEPMTPPAEDLPDVAEGLSDVLRAEFLSRSPSRFTCPECGGALWEIQSGNMLRYLCHVGHGFTSEALVTVHTDHVERALWSAIRLLEESAALYRRMGDEFREKGLKISSERFATKAVDREQHANILRNLLTNGASVTSAESAEIAEELRPEYENKNR